MNKTVNLMDISAFLNEDFLENELQEIRGGTEEDKETEVVNNSNGCGCIINPTK